MIYIVNIGYIYIYIYIESETPCERVGLEKRIVETYQNHLNLDLQELNAVQTDLRSPMGAGTGKAIEQTNAIIQGFTPSFEPNNPKNFPQSSLNSLVDQQISLLQNKNNILDKIVINDTHSNTNGRVSRESSKIIEKRENSSIFKEGIDRTLVPLVGGISQEGELIDGFSFDEEVMNNQQYTQNSIPLVPPLNSSKTTAFGMEMITDGEIIITPNLSTYIYIYI